MPKSSPSASAPKVSHARRAGVGGEAKAATGEMTVMASGSPHAFAACEAVLAAIAQKVYRLGDAAGTGSKVKMINSCWRACISRPPQRRWLWASRPVPIPACSTK